MITSVGKTIKRRWKLLLIVAVAAVLVAALVVWITADAVVVDDLGSVVTVQREDMVVSVIESGELEAQERKVISNKLRWPVIITWVAPDGSMVAKGAPIVKFECKELLEAIENERLAVTAAENDYTQAKETLELKKKEVANSVRNAEDALLNAKEDRIRYKEGDWPIMKNQAESDIQMARRDLALAKEKLDFKLKVNNDPELNSPYSENEIEAEKLAVDRLGLALEKAISDRDVLLKYTHPRKKRQLEAAVEQAELNLERAKLEAKTQIMINTAAEHAKKSTLELRRSKLEELLENEKELVQTAEEKGLVVYDTGGNRWNPSTVTVQVGEEMRPRQQMMIIPNMESLQIETKVYEARINEVADGLPVYVRLDFSPEKRYRAHVAKVGVLPDSQNRWLNPGVKVFEVMVKLDEEVEGLKPGLTAQVEIVLARLSNVLTVPIAAVFTQQDQTYVWRLEGGEPRRVAVTVGKMNDEKVQILAGLDEGDELLLVPPKGADGEVLKPNGDKPAGKKPARPAPKEGRAS